MRSTSSGGRHTLLAAILSLCIVGVNSSLLFDLNPALPLSQGKPWAHAVGSPTQIDIPLQLRLDPTPPGTNASAVVYGIVGKSYARVQVPLFVTPPITVGQIYPIILAITTSRVATVGSVQVWWRGKLQTLETGGKILHLATWDGLSVDPEWGVYGAWATALKTAVGRLGTTLADVLP